MDEIKSFFEAEAIAHERCPKCDAAFDGAMKRIYLRSVNRLAWQCPCGWTFESQTADAPIEVPR